MFHFPVCLSCSSTYSALPRHSRDLVSRDRQFSEQLPPTDTVCFVCSFVIWCAWCSSVSQDAEEKEVNVLSLSARGPGPASHRERDRDWKERMAHQPMHPQHPFVTTSSKTDKLLASDQGRTWSYAGQTPSAYLNVAGAQTTTTTAATGQSSARASTKLQPYVRQGAQQLRALMKKSPVQSP